MSSETVTHQTAWLGNAMLRGRLPIALVLAALLAAQAGAYPWLSALLALLLGGLLYARSAKIAKAMAATEALHGQLAECSARLNQEKAATAALREAAVAAEHARLSFVAGMSHELRTPLNAMLGMAQALDRGNLEKPQWDQLKVLLEGGQGLKALLDDIVAYGLPAEEMPPGPEEGCDAAQAVQTVSRLIQPKA